MMLTKKQSELMARPCRCLLYFYVMSTTVKSIHCWKEKDINRFLTAK